MRVLLVDPSPLSRSCLLAGFRESSEISIVACGHVDELPENPFPEGVNVIILQAAGQHLESREFTERLTALSRRFPGAGIMLLSGPEDTDQMLTGLQLGVRAYITGDVGLAPTIGAIRLISEGLVVYPNTLLGAFRGAAVPTARSGVPQAEMTARPGGEILTPRQHDVLRLLARGLSNKAIAAELDISESTVKVHIRAIMERTGMLNRTQIVAHFFRDWH